MLINTEICKKFPNAQHTPLTQVWGLCLLPLIKSLLLSLYLLFQGPMISLDNSSSGHSSQDVKSDTAQYQELPNIVKRTFQNIARNSGAGDQENQV